MNIDELAREDGIKRGYEKLAYCIVAITTNDYIEHVRACEQATNEDEWKAAATTAAFCEQWFLNSLISQYVLPNPRAYFAAINRAIKNGEDVNLINYWDGNGGRL